MTKKILLLICLLLTAATAIHADSFYYESGGTALCFRILDESARTCELTPAREKYAGEIIVPSTVQNGDLTYEVTAVGEYAFYECFDLTSVTLPESITSISDNAFAYCSNLTAIYGKYATDDNRCLIIDGKLIAFAPAGLTSYTVSNSVTLIGSSTFADSGELTSLTIPSSVNRIGTNAFRDCKNLSSLYVYIRDPSTLVIESNIFEGVPVETCILYVPKGTKQLYATADQWSAFANIVEMGATFEMSYDGRWISFMTADPNKTIYYTLDGTEPTAQSEVYTEPVDVGGLGIVRAVAANQGFSDCEYIDYEIPAYYNGEEALIGIPGMLDVAFGWIDHAEIAALMVRGEMGEADWECLRALHNLHDLDLFEVFADNIPNGALAGSNITYVSMPRETFNVGEHLFEGCENLCAVKWNAIMTPLTNGPVAGINSPNVLLYVDDETSTPSLIANVIVNGQAKDITLSDGYPFYCPLPFQAENISYTHEYTQQTPIGGCAGWETLALPFDVQRISHEDKGEIKPFPAATGADRPFWLYELADSTFVPTEHILANRPYIVSFPNNEAYSEEYILAGNITFEASSCYVPETETYVAEDNGLMFVPAFARVPRSERIYALNIYDQRLTAGSCFLADYRDIEPFEAYLTTPYWSMRAPILHIGEMMDTPAALPIITLGDGQKEYYTIQGIKVDNPLPGHVYIVKQGSVVTKTLIR